MLRHICPERALAWIRQLLRCAESDVGEVTVAVSGEWPRTAHSEALDHQFGIRQRRCLFGHILGRLDGALCSLDCGIVLSGFSDEQLQTRWSVLAESRCGPKNKHTDFADVGHFASHVLEMKSNEDTTVPSPFCVRRRNQILRTVAVCGGPSGG